MREGEAIVGLEDGGAEGSSIGSKVLVEVETGRTIEEGPGQAEDVGDKRGFSDERAEGPLEVVRVEEEGWITKERGA